MIGRLGPHDFLLHLRCRLPALARRLDGICGLSLSAQVLVVRLRRGSWSEAEISGSLDDLRAAVLDFFGPGTEVALESATEDPEALPFPVLATKVWNHVAFWLPRGEVSAVLALRKPLYLEKWLPLAAEGDDAVARDALGDEVFAKTYGGPIDFSGGEAGLPWQLPDLLDDLCELGRTHRSYVQLVIPFPGDGVADHLESRLYAAKEWGTPKTPSAILQKYVGRLHYVSPGNLLLGLRVARALP